MRLCHPQCNVRIVASDNLALLCQTAICWRYHAGVPQNIDEFYPRA